MAPPQQALPSSPLVSMPTFQTDANGVAVLSATYTHISSNATTTCKSGSGTLYAVVINTKGASSNTATLYDNTAGSGTIIAGIDTTAVTGTLAYGLHFSIGLTAVTATGTAPDLTIITS